MTQPITPTFASKAKQATTGMLAVTKLLVTGVAIPILVSIATSFYVNTHLLKPKLIAQYSSSVTLVVPVRGVPNQFAAVLVDLTSGLRAPLPPGVKTIGQIRTPLSVTGGEVVSAKHLTFKNAKDYDYVFSPGSDLTKIMIDNEGYTSANHVNIGLSLWKGWIDHKIVPSPNIHISEQAIVTDGANPSFVRVTIDRIGASEKALLTLVTDKGDAPNLPATETPYLTIHKNAGLDPILYLTSDEGTGTVASRGIGWKDAMKWEETNFPNSIIGFWASSLRPKRGVSPVIEDMPALTLQYDLVDDSGKQTGTGTMKLEHQE